MAFVQIKNEKLVERNLLTLDFFDNLKVNNLAKTFHQSRFFFVFLSLFLFFFVVSFLFFSFMKNCRFVKWRMSESFWDKPCPQGFEVYTWTSSMKTSISDIKRFLSRLWEKGYSITAYSIPVFHNGVCGYSITADSCIFTPSVRSK